MGVYHTGRAFVGDGVDGADPDNGHAVSFDFEDGGGVGVLVGGEVGVLSEEDGGGGVVVVYGVGCVLGVVLGVFLRKRNLSRR